PSPGSAPGSPRQTVRAEVTPASTVLGLLSTCDCSRREPLFTSAPTQEDAPSPKPGAAIPSVDARDPRRLDLVDQLLEVLQTLAWQLCAVDLVDIDGVTHHHSANRAHGQMRLALEDIDAGLFEGDGEILVHLAFEGLGALGDHALDALDIVALVGRLEAQ